MIGQEDFHRIFKDSGSFDQALGYATPRIVEEKQFQPEESDAPLYVRIGEVTGDNI